MDAKRPAIKHWTVVLDCPDPNSLADFYAELLGWTKNDAESEFISVAKGWRELPYLLFQKAEDYRPPLWPDAPEAQRQMLHMDFAVKDLQAGVDFALSLGASLAQKQFSDKWRVLLDPAGHPFCLCQADWMEE